jgi:hypothetical protein
MSWDSKLLILFVKQCENLFQYRVDCHILPSEYKPMSISFIIERREAKTEEHTIKLFLCVAPQEPTEIRRYIILPADDLDESEEFDSTCWNADQRVCAHIIGKILSAPDSPESLVAWYATVAFASAILDRTWMERKINQDTPSVNKIVLTEASILESLGSLRTPYRNASEFLLLSGTPIEYYLVGELQRNPTTVSSVQERIKRKTTSYLEQLRFSISVIEDVQREIDLIDRSFLDDYRSRLEANADPMSRSWFSYFRDLDGTDLRLFCPSKPFSSKKAYKAIRLWYQSHTAELSRLRPRTDGYIQRTIKFIEALPAPDRIDTLEIRAVFQEVIMGLLEWAYHDSDGKYKMGEYAKLALQGEGLPLRLSEDELNILTSSWISPFVKRPAVTETLPATPVEANKRAVFQLDQATWQLLSSLAQNSEDSPLEIIAVDQLAKYWRDDQTRRLLISLAHDRAYSEAGSTAVHSVADYWRDERTRLLLISLARNSSDSQAGTTAVRTLAFYWRDEETRQLLISLAQNHTDTEAASAAVAGLAHYWRDEATRQLLTSLIQDSADSRAASPAVEHLGNCWRDDATRRLLTWLVENNPNSHGGGAAIRSLAENWRDEATRQLITSLVENCGDSGEGGAAVACLAEHWRDEATRRLLVSLIQDGDDTWAGMAAVESLGKYWDDETTRELLTSLIETKPESTLAMKAVEPLAGQWRNEETRLLLASLAQKSFNSYAAGRAVTHLARHWCSDETRQLLISIDENFHDSLAGTAAVEALSMYWPNNSRRVG